MRKGGISIFLILCCFLMLLASAYAGIWRRYGRELAREGYALEEGQGRAFRPQHARISASGLLSNEILKQCVVSDLPGANACLLHLRRLSKLSFLHLPCPSLYFFLPASRPARPLAAFCNIFRSQEITGLLLTFRLLN